MSSNKLKYFRVEQTAIVAANNKRDAVDIARGRRGITGRLLGETGETTRISASEAHTGSDESSRVMSV